jgi:hypothetical protein
VNTDRSPPSRETRRQADRPALHRRIPDAGSFGARWFGHPDSMSETSPQQDKDYDPEADPDTDPPETGEQVEADADRDQAEGE